MPQVMTYSSLLSDLQNYLQRYDATILNQIPRFMMLAQQAVTRDLKILGFREEVTGAFDPGIQTTGLMAKPSDWRKNISFYVSTGASFNNHSPVLFRGYEFVRTIYPNSTVTGTPRYYADADWNHWLIGPSPNISIAPYFKIPYYGTLVFIDPTSQTNWLTENAPDWLLYRCLLEASGFVKTDERTPAWQAQYDKATQSLLKQEIKGMIDRQGSMVEN